MNSRILAVGVTFIAILLLPGLAHADSGQITILDCDNEIRCIPMELDISDAKKQEVVVSKKELSNGYTLFELKLHGNLKGKSALLTVYFKGYTDGIECSGFGQGNAGFLGNSLAGNPIVRTSSGPLELLGQDLTVGCKDCIREAKNDGKSYLSTSLDLTLTNKKESDFTVDKTGNQFIQQSTSCLLVPKNQLLKLSQPVMCGSKNTNSIPIKIRTESCS